MTRECSLVFIEKKEREDLNVLSLYFRVHFESFK